jgi:hypothetical protein
VKQGTRDHENTTVGTDDVGSKDWSRVHRETELLTDDRNYEAVTRD